ncbi:class 1 internalin InlH [Klugiella xanthotipulae]|uniref:LRR adjacent protein n=1 Tax=Klugiella xanthotipulae TaxID=244735 RepID=A0A543I4T5_9MICO|nr:leucine-rich repeat domain-containing protein [Klugiella xanthotipulae]TQM65618.1 LRR adjacent protein [Klugiella xanthotipulae]
MHSSEQIHARVPARGGRRAAWRVGLGGLVLASLVAAPILGFSAAPAAAADQRLGDILADPQLAACVATALGTTPATVVTPTTLAGLKNLNCANRGIVSLSGIENLSGLEQVLLDKNPITDLTPLAGVPSIWLLGLSETPANDLSPVYQLGELQWLNLGNSGVTSIAGIERLTDLRRTFLDSNAGLSDIRPLAALPYLNTLYLNKDSVTDLSPLSAMKSLRYLNISENGVSNIAPLGSLTGLQTLNAEGNAIADVSAFSTMTALSTISVSGQRVVLPSTPFAANLDVPTPVTTVNGSAVALSELSNAGTYSAGAAHWTGLSDSLTEVTATFGAYPQVPSGAYISFTGTVVQPFGVPRVLVAPGEPGGVRATGSNETIDVSWVAPEVGSSAITSYLLEYKTNDDDWTRVSIPAPGTTATLGGLVNGSTYQLRVTAVNSDLSGVAGAETSAVPYLFEPVFTDGSEGKQIVTGGEVSPGTDVAVAATGLPAGSTVTFELHSTPQILATGTVENNGSVTLNGTLPGDIAGNHELVAVLDVAGVESRGAVSIVILPPVAAAPRIDPPSVPGGENSAAPSGSANRPAPAASGTAAAATLAVTGGGSLPLALLAGVTLVLAGGARVRSRKPRV